MSFKLKVGGSLSPGFPAQPTDFAAMKRQRRADKERKKKAQHSAQSANLGASSNSATNQSGSEVETPHLGSGAPPLSADRPQTSASPQVQPAPPQQAKVELALPSAVVSGTLGVPTADDKDPDPGTGSQSRKSAGRGGWTVDEALEHSMQKQKDLSTL